MFRHAIRPLLHRVVGRGWFCSLMLEAAVARPGTTTGLGAPTFLVHGGSYYPHIVCRILPARVGTYTLCCTPTRLFLRLVSSFHTSPWGRGALALACLRSCFGYLPNLAFDAEFRTLFRFQSILFFLCFIKQAFWFDSNLEISFSYVS